MLNSKIICGPESGSTKTQSILENVVITTEDNAEGLYIDGTGDAGSPVYVGITKSQGNQDRKLPVEAGEIIGGLQVYSRKLEGNSLGYEHKETPLNGSIIFKVADDYKSVNNYIPSELLVAVADEENLSVRLVLDSKGNLSVTGNISGGEITITDQEVPADDIPDRFVTRFVKAIYKGKQYAIPLYSIQETLP